MNRPQPRPAARRRALVVHPGLWLCVVALTAGCGDVEAFLDHSPPQGVLRYSANPAQVGDLVIQAKFDEPLAAPPEVQVARPGQTAAPPAAMLGAGSTWRYDYRIVPAGGMAALSEPATVTVSGIADQAGNVAAPLLDQNLLVHAPDPAQAADSLDNVQFAKRDAPVLLPDPPGAWDHSSMSVGDVLKVGDAYLLYYTASATEGGPGMIGLATSTNGLDWVKHSEPVITIGDPGAWDSGLAIHPAVLWEDGLYRMWYVGQPSGGDNASFRFGYTTSTDGVQWQPAVPVLGPGPAGAWDEERIGGLDVAKIGDLYYLYYTATTLTPEFKRQIGCATSPDGQTWTKCAGNPILQPIENSVPFEGNEVEGPNVISVYGSWLMAYTGYGGYQGKNFNIGLARSPDGTHWQRLDRTPALPWGPAGSIDETGTGQPALLIEGNKLWMWYTGHHSDSTSIALAVAILN